MSRETFHRMRHSQIAVLVSCNVRTRTGLGFYLRDVVVLSKHSSCFARLSLEPTRDCRLALQLVALI